MSLHTINLITPPLALAFVVAVFLALAARAARLLTRDGAFAAFVVGFVVFGLGGGKFTVPLLAFFLTSSLLSRVGRASKAPARAYTAKSEIRDCWQVAANGGAAAALVVVFHFTNKYSPILQTRNLLMLYLAALAAGNADTWATEIGILAKSRPRHLATWRVVPPGTSGAITVLGLVAAAAGAAAIPLSALPFWHLDSVEFLTVTWAGFLGSLTDSLLGASLQSVYRDPATDELTERTEIDGRPTVRARGLRWLNNDAVNFIASLLAVLFAWLLLRYAAGPFR